MLDPHKIQLYLSVFKNLDLDDLVSLFKIARTRQLAPNELYIKEGVTVKKLAYIKEGLVRAYCIKDNGDEITTLVRWEDQMIASYDNIIFDRPSRFTYQAIEKTTLLEIDYDIVQSFIKKNPKLEEGRRHFLIKMLGESISRVESFVLLSPEERYKQFIKEKPGIANRLPNKYIASLLGVTPVSLSRIRKRIATTGKR